MDENIDRKATVDVAATFSAAYEALNYILYGPRSRIVPEDKGKDDYAVMYSVGAYTVIDKNLPGVFGGMNPTEFILNLTGMFEHSQDKSRKDQPFHILQTVQEIIPLEYD